ncbi:MAG: hypothetical protein II060_03080, partial [Bacteroidales bacterium]|nr:hypothetical protein [Bacteroidales bacterium]
RDCENFLKKHFFQKILQFRTLCTSSKLLWQLAVFLFVSGLKPKTQNSISCIIFAAHKSTQIFLSDQTFLAIFLPFLLLFFKGDIIKIVNLST